MSAKMKIQNPKSVPVTLEATFTMEEWREISEQLRGAELYRGGGKLRRQIQDLSFEMERILQAHDGEES